MISIKSVTSLKIRPKKNNINFKKNNIRGILLCVETIITQIPSQEK